LAKADIRFSDALPIGGVFYFLFLFVSLRPMQSYQIDNAIINHAARFA